MRNSSLITEGRNVLRRMPGAGAGAVTAGSPPTRAPLAPGTGAHQRLRESFGFYSGPLLPLPSPGPGARRGGRTPLLPAARRRSARSWSRVRRRGRGTAARRPPPRWGCPGSGAASVRLPGARPRSRGRATCRSGWGTGRPGTPPPPRRGDPSAPPAASVPAGSAPSSRDPAARSPSRPLGTPGCSERPPQERPQPPLEELRGSRKNSPPFSSSCQDKGRRPDAQTQTGEDANWEGVLPRLKFPPPPMGFPGSAYLRAGPIGEQHCQPMRRRRLI